MTETLQELGISAELIPSSRYTSTEFAELEAERLWPRVWQMACREESLANDNDFFEYTIGDQSVLIVRVDGRLKAYVNACLHRGTRLRSGCGHLRGLLRCRYHGWAWDLEGAIRDVPDRHEFAPQCVSDEALQLPEVSVDAWGGFVFVNLDPEAEPLLDYLGPVADRLEQFALENLRLASWRSAVLPCNWKAAIDAFIEVYHLEGTHAMDLGGVDSPAELVDWERGEDNSTQASQGFTLENYTLHNWIGQRAGRPDHDRRISDLGDDPKRALAHLVDGMAVNGLAHEREAEYIRAMPDAIPDDATLNAFMVALRREMAAEAGIDLSAASDSALRSGELVVHVFPNMTIPAGAANTVFLRFRPNGSDPDSCIMDIGFLHRYPDGDEPGVELEWVPDWKAHGKEWGQLVWQDLCNLEFVQAGLHQRRFPGLRLSSMENNIRNFHRAISRYVED